MDVKEECLPMYRRLYRWHTNEILKAETEISASTDANKKKAQTIVKMRLIAERKRIQKIYPDVFSQDRFDITPN